MPRAINGFCAAILAREANCVAETKGTARTETVVTLADTPDAEAIATRFGVPAAIHASDFMFMFHLGPDQAEWPRTRPGATERYLSDGARSATRLNELVRRFHSNRGQRVLRVLEFASGCRMVLRHRAHERSVRIDRL